MSAFRKGFSGFAIAALASASLVGCGGSSGSLPAPSPVPVEVEGGLVTKEGVTDAEIPASDSARTALVTVDGVSVVVSLPAGVAIPAGTPLAIIPADTEFITGLSGGARNPGDIKVNGKIMGSKVVNGRIRPAIGVPSGRWTLEAEGPFTIRQGSSTLTMQKVAFTFDSNGRVTSLPTSISGAIPANGSNNWKNQLASTYVAPYNTGTARLTITHSNGTLDQVRDLISGVATFKDFADDQQSKIPAQGVNLVTFSHISE